MSIMNGSDDIKWDRVNSEDEKSLKKEANVAEATAKSFDVRRVCS